LDTIACPDWVAFSAAIRAWARWVARLPRATLFSTGQASESPTCPAGPLTFCEKELRAPPARLLADAAPPA